MKPTYEQLEKEVARLRSKLSPLEDKEFTAQVTERLALNLTKVKLVAGLNAKVRGRDCVSGGLADLWAAIFSCEGNMREHTKLGRSLQAMGWERGAKRGNLVFTIPVEEL